MAQDAWNPSQYERFRAERRQPFDDLVALVRVRPHMRVIDLGCGTGDLTAELHDRLPAAETVGLDRSQAMLERSAAHARPGLRFVAGDVAALEAAGTYDLVFSNATLQWLPRHEQLFARLVTALAPGGQLAVQVPTNFDHPAHVTAREIAGEEPFASALAGQDVRFPSVLPPEEYAVLLDRLGCAEQHVRLQVYAHRLASRDEVVEWIRGTGLTAYESKLTPEMFGAFLERYRDRLLPRLEDRRPYLYPFKRILLWAQVP